MTRWITRADAIQASLFTTFGALMLTGTLSVPFGPAAVAVLLIVLGVMVLAGSIDGPKWLGVTLLAIALTFVIANPIGRALSGIVETWLTLVAGATPLAVGVVKLSPGTLSIPIGGARAQRH